MIKFSDSLHESTEDGFKIEFYRGKIFIRIYQEMDSGIVRETYLSLSDIQQINHEIKQEVNKK